MEYLSRLYDERIHVEKELSVHEQRARYVTWQTTFYTNMVIVYN